MANTKKVTAASIKGKSLYDVVTTKSKKFVDAIKAPFIKSKLKGDFATNINAVARHIIDLKGKEIELLMNVNNINVAAILDIHSDKASAFDEMMGLAAIYKNLFGEEIELPLTKEDLDVVATDVLAAAIEEVEEDED